MPRMELGCLISQEQKHILSQQQVESLDILSMDMQELKEYLQREQDENPLLNFTGGSLPRTSLCYLDDDKIQSIPYVREETAWDILMPQLNLANYSAREAEAFQLLASALDDDGFMRSSIEELAALSNIPTSLLRSCLNVMQTLDPPGVCSISLQECLKRQLLVLGSDDPVLLAIVERHLVDVAELRIKTIAQSLETTTEHVRHCIQTIRTLNPRPLNGLIGGTSTYIVPDLTLTHTNGTWDVELNDRWVGRFEICDYYAMLARRTDDNDLREYLMLRMQRARFLNDSIERRRNTLRQIGWGLVRRHAAYFLQQKPLAALTMTKLAEELDIHTSTLSRAIRGKFLRHPGGVCAIRSLFVYGIPASTGNTTGTSREDVKNRLRVLILQEDKLSPHSDNRLVFLLKAQGIAVSRRTVAKYRDELGIRGMHDRRYL